MVLTGAFVNGIAIIVGACLGLLLRRGISSKVGDTVMQGLALIVFYIGLTGALKGQHIIMEVLSMSIGAVIGETVDLDRKMQALGNMADKLFKSKEGENSVSKGFVVASLLFCVGAMGIVGALQSGMQLNHETLFAKALIDGIAALVMTTTLGIGVALSGAMVFLYEDGISLVAKAISPFLTTEVINEISCVGSILIVGLSFNMLNITKIKIMNLVPSVFVPIILFLFVK